MTIFEKTDRVVKSKLDEVVCKVCFKDIIVKICYDVEVYANELHTK